MNDQCHVGIICLGKTGLSCLQYLHRQGYQLSLFEENPAATNLSWVRQHYPQINLHTGPLQPQHLTALQRLVVSPGVPLNQPIFQWCRQQKIALLGDIELFARHYQGTVIAITGSNGKSTVTAMVGDILKEAGLSTTVAGNIGLPVLDQLEQATDYAVLEISSYQLELTESLQPKIATILNISPDHLDRYDGYEDYVAAKQRIYHQAEWALVNLEDAQTFPSQGSIPQLTFTSQEPTAEGYGLRQQGQQIYLAHGDQHLLAVEQLKIKGRHNWLNALAAYAIARQLGIADDSIQQSLCNFAGLPHRCQWLRSINQVAYYNDSKGTNMGATLAALQGLGQGIKGKIILLAGGQGKDADFTPLTAAARALCREVILFGEDKDQLAAVLKEHSAIQLVADLAAAVQRAYQIAQPGDIVLLSPACASFDMFKNFEHRGDVFSELVKELSS